MDGTRFDTITRFFADRRLSRRQALTRGGAGLAAGALAATGLGAAHAQEATPAPEEEKVATLFVQSFQAGSIAPKAGEDGSYSLTLAQGLGQTIYFSDRPERIVGAAPTPQFLEGLGFSPDNPPNAALVVETASGETEIAVVELTNPTYETTTHTATYDVQVLAEWENELGIGLTETPADLAAFGESFGPAHLFIDDCPNVTNCYDYYGVYVGTIPGGPYGQCWSLGTLCQPNTSPCNGPSIFTLVDLCNRTYGRKCAPDGVSCYAA